MKEQLEKIIERKLNTNVKVLNIVESIERTREIWEPRVKNHKSDLKMAAYYGCLLVRPPDIVKFDNPENPQSIEKLIKDFGYQPVQWEFRTECCGGGFTVSNAGDVATLVGRIYDDALFHEADAIVCVCPMCLANLEMRTGEASAKFKREFKMPVVYLTDLLGLAIGMKPASFGFDKHLSDISKVAQVSV
jgi:heterodisulfide reductase subunit B